MPAPIALQLYTVRDTLVGDFEGVVRHVAAIGYAGVEPAGFYGSGPAEAAALFTDLGLQVPSAHLPMPVGDARAESIDTASALGAGRIVSGLGPDGFETIDALNRSCAVFNEAAAAAGEAGLRFAIHNHWWEFGEIDGRAAFDLMLERLDPAVEFEVDTYWAQTAGSDPAAVVGRLGMRAALLHIKDGPCTRDEPMTAVGDGKVDFPAIVAAAAGTTEWMIVELDVCATDMMAAVEKSYAYLIEKELARGR